MIDTYSALHGQATVQKAAEPRLPAATENIWIDITAGSPKDAVNILKKLFNCPPFILEHITQKLHRPRISNYEPFHHIAFSALQSAPTSKATTEILHIVFTDHLLLTYHSNTIPAIDSLKSRLQQVGGATLLGDSIGFFLYNLLDEIIDAKLVHLDSFQDDIDKIENAALQKPSYKLNEVLLDKRRGMQTERRLATAERDVLNHLLRAEFALAGRELDRYFLDLYDHISRIVDVVDTRREQLTDIAQLLMAVTAQRTNDIMKVLTIVSTIFMPLTLVVGIYGMNFVHMPELHWRLGYPLVLMAMLAMTVGMLAYFRKRGWI